jgi:3-oxoacyl-(acyl-carrier-protein) synthase
VIDPLSLSSRPFDSASRGGVGGEAAVSFILESAGQAASRGRTPIAKIASIASRFSAAPTMNQSARSLDACSDAGRGSARAIELSITAAMQDAGLSAGDIGAVISQACGDVSIDRCEQQAIESCLPGVPVTAPIAALGHTGAAAGAINVAVAAMALEHREIPPTIGMDVASRTPSLFGESKLLNKSAVMSLSHTSEGSAIATVLVQP